MTIIQQSELRKKGGFCAKYPSSCVVRMLLKDAGLFKPFKTIKVLDLTFGQGIFYYSFKSVVQVYGFDIKRLNWVTKPYKFFNMSCDKWKKKIDEDHFDLIVVDPPFSPYDRGWERRLHYKDNGNISLCLTEALKAAEKYNAPMLIHFIWKIIPYGFKPIVEVWFQGWSRLTKMNRPTWFGIIVKEED